jgi:plastocyanin
MRELYRRVLLPFAIALVAVAVIVLVVLDLSRAELALAGRAATVAAAAAASAILAGAVWISRREAGSSGGPLLVAGLVVVFGGLVGLARLDEKASQAAQARQRQHEAANVNDAGVPFVTITAFDIGFREHQVTVPAGRMRIIYVDDGQLTHTLVLDGVPSFHRLEVQGNGDRAVGTANLSPGDYVFYCDIPGHRAAGMQGTLTVT